MYLNVAGQCQERPSVHVGVALSFSPPSLPPVPCSLPFRFHRFLPPLCCLWRRRCRLCLTCHCCAVRSAHSVTGWNFFTVLVSNTARRQRGQRGRRPPHKITAQPPQLTITEPGGGFTVERSRVIVCVPRGCCRHSAAVSLSLSPFFRNSHHAS